MPISSDRRAYSTRTGKVAETRFKLAAEAIGLQVTKSNAYDDRSRHVDFWMAYNGKGKWGVDVKGNNLPMEIWCEFNNVAGDKGWLYGEAKIIAFDMPEEGGFLIVDRVDLANYCEQNVEDVFVKTTAEAYKKKYQREGRLDVITKLSIMDISSIPSYRVWYYFKGYC